MIIDSLELQDNNVNTLAAGVANYVFSLRKDIIKESLKDFKSFEHRLEFVLRIHGIDFINDSKATKVNAAWYALETINRPIIWIAGGIDKKNNYNTIKELVKQKVKAIICIGKDNSRLIKYFSKITPNIIETPFINEAVNTAYSFGEINDVVLLSPACPSFDLYSNYEDRGRKFKKAVYNL